MYYEDCDRRTCPNPRDPLLRRWRWGCQLFPRLPYSYCSELKNKRGESFDIIIRVIYSFKKKKRKELLEQITRRLFYLRLLIEWWIKRTRVLIMPRNFLKFDWHISLATNDKRIMAYRCYLRVLCFRVSPAWRSSRWRWSAFRDARDRHDRIPRPYKWWFAPDSYSPLWYYSRRSASAATPADVGTCRCCTCSAPGTTCSRNQAPSSGSPNSCRSLDTWARLSGRWPCSS